MHKSPRATPVPWGKENQRRILPTSDGAHLLHQRTQATGASTGERAGVL